MTYRKSNHYVICERHHHYSYGNPTIEKNFIQILLEKLFKEPKERTSGILKSVKVNFQTNAQYPVDFV